MKLKINTTTCEADVTIEYKDVASTGPGFVQADNALVMRGVAVSNAGPYDFGITLESEAVIAIVRAAREGGICK